MGSMPVGLRREEEVQSWYTPIVWPIRSTASASHLDSRRTIVWWIRSTATAIQLVSRMAIRTQNSTNTKSSLTLRSTCFLFPWEYKHCQAIEWISKALFLSTFSPYITNRFYMLYWHYMYVYSFKDNAF